RKQDKQELHADKPALHSGKLVLRNADKPALHSANPEPQVLRNADKRVSAKRERQAKAQRRVAKAQQRVRKVRVARKPVRELRPKATGKQISTRTSSTAIATSITSTPT
ncbi:MAG TPA: hypothetical protein VFV99_23180, partial [Kofleriaceae bacterium]|nr:hypothetical protein [Kofleriaceae bacterium]